MTQDGYKIILQCLKKDDFKAPVRRKNPLKFDIMTVK